MRKLFGQQIGLRQTVGAGLRDIGQRHAPLAAIAKRTFELVGVLRGGDDRNLADAAQHQHRQRIVNHWFIIDRQQLFGHGDCDRIQPRARATGEDDPFAFGVLRHGKSVLAAIKLGQNLAEAVAPVGM